MLSWSGWKFGPNSTEYPYSEIQNIENCDLEQFDFSVSEYPEQKFRQILALLTFQFEYPRPPKIEI